MSDDKEWARPVYPVLLALAQGWEPRFPWEKAKVREEATRVLEDLCRAIPRESLSAWQSGCARKCALYPACMCGKSDESSKASPKC